MSSTYDRIAGLPLRIEGYSLEVLTLELTPEFRRLTTVIRLHGGGEEGVGEDVCYEESEHRSQADAGPVLPLAGEFDLDGFSERLGRPRPLPRRRGRAPQAVDRLPALGL